MATLTQVNARKFQEIVSVGCKGEEIHEALYDPKKQVIFERGDETSLDDLLHEFMGNYHGLRFKDSYDGRIATRKPDQVRRFNAFCESIPEFKKMYEDLIATAEPLLKEGDMVWTHFESEVHRVGRKGHNFFTVGPIAGYRLKNGCGVDGEEFSTVEVIRVFTNTNNGNKWVTFEKGFGSVANYEEWTLLDKAVKSLKKQLKIDKALGATVLWSGKAYKV